MRAPAAELAAAGKSAGDYAFDSKVVCRPLKQAKHSKPDNLCTLNNVVFNMGPPRAPSRGQHPPACYPSVRGRRRGAWGWAGQLKSEEETGAVMRKYVESKHVVLPYIAWAQGALRGACRKTNSDMYAAAPAPARGAPARKPEAPRAGQVGR